MPSVTVKVKYSSTGGKPTSTTSTSFVVNSKNPTESELTAKIRQKNPKWNFYILDYKVK